MNTKSLAGFVFRLAIGCAAVILAHAAPAQNLYVTTWYYPGGINVVPPGGGSSSSFDSGGFFGEPLQIAFDSQGNLFVPDEYDHVIDKVTPGGTETTFAPSAGQAIGLAFSSSGTLYGTDYSGGNLYAYNSGGIQTTYATGLIDPTGLAFDASGDLFYVSYTGNGAIYEFKKNNGTLSTTATVYASGLANPYGIAFDAHGNLYATLQGPTPGSTGGSVVEIAPGDTSQATLVTGLKEPSFIAFDPSGNFYLCEVSLDSVMKYQANGTSDGLYASVTGASGLAFQGQLLPVPEPNTWALMGMGAGALLLYRRRCVKAA